MKGVSFSDRRAQAAAGFFLVLSLLLLLPFCSIDPVHREYRYRVTVEIVNPAERPLTVAVDSPPGTVGFPSDSTADPAWSHSLTGDIEYYDAGGLPVLELVTVSVSGTLSAGESYTVRIYYEELSKNPWIREAALIEPPVTRAHSGGAAPEAVSFLKVFAVPR